MIETTGIIVVETSSPEELLESTSGSSRIHMPPFKHIHCVEVDEVEVEAVVVIVDVGHANELQSREFVKLGQLDPPNMGLVMTSRS